MQWLQQPVALIFLAGTVFCSVSLFRYYGDATYLYARAQEEANRGELARAEMYRNDANAAQLKNVLWGVGAIVTVIPGLFLFLRPYFRGRTPPARDNAAAP